MQTSIQIPEVSTTALWIGRIMSGLVILFLLTDSAMKLVPLDIVNATSRELGIPEHLSRLFGVLLLVGVALYTWPRTSVLAAIFLTGYLGGAIYVHVRAGSPLFSHTLFGVYLALLMWGGLYLRDGLVRVLIPLRR
jgi:DoxX-like protein